MLNDHLDKFQRLRRESHMTQVSAEDKTLTVCMEIEGESGTKGALAAELVYAFKYENDLSLLTDFTDTGVTIEFLIAPADYESVVRFTTRLKAYGLKVQTNVLPS